ncbi:galactonate dehydratase [Phytohabitans sp. ZYX-F-186]|uniref:Galactonate dehydratase n=1 Tax=Phytohabitans maris TaxID=3071409 RepID=A0ABU0ZW00_9ACTN|nr:galactonate dehydratase [Phytohabitans sp. ZYX-F-186]MDQ7911209.1 galactonate dehydratase [Phytohabitans sp. ZYX-F-186]
MKITRLETFLVPPRLLFLRVETDDGVVGWGEPIVEGRAHTVRAAIEELADYLVGQDPLRIEDHWQVLTRGGFYRGGAILASAVAGIDQALWDIAGKVRGAPVHEVLGGPLRDRVRVYAGVRGDRPEAMAEQARQAAANGYTAVKLGSVQLPPLGPPSDVDAIVARMAAVREAVGDGCDVAIDLHGRPTVPLARLLVRELEPFRPLFVEEPLRPELSDQIGRIVEVTPVPIATGERLYHRTEFRPVLEGGVAVVQPDVSHAGGITETRRIAAVAEMYDALVAPHSPLGPIALAACLQVACSVPNFLVQEQTLGVHDLSWMDWLVDRDVFRFAGGYLDRLTGPGLGIDVDEAVVRELDREGHRFRSTVWRHADGSFAEW